MTIQSPLLRGLKFAAAFAVALTMAACANKSGVDANGALAGAATPGSQQDFVVNVGDRVFFESDSTDLTPQSVATPALTAALTQKPKLSPEACGRRLIGVPC